MSVSKLPTVVRAEAYHPLDAEDLGTGVEPQGLGSRKACLASFLKDHLPTQRIRANEDDLSSKFESVDCSRRRKKKKTKSKASISRGPWTRLQKRSHRHFKPSSETLYDKYLPLMEMWKHYMEELIQFSSLTDSNLAAAAQKMMKADFHGCPLTVQRSKCASYIGVQGIVIQETRNTFMLVTPDNTVKCVPKANSIFCIVLHGHIFKIYGNQFRIKPGERAAKKFKLKPSIDL